MNRAAMLVALTVISLASSMVRGTTQWDASDYNLYAGDFNGDGQTDILYVAKSASNLSGIALSNGTGPNIPLQSWPSNYLGIPWSGNQYNVIVADFNGDGCADIFLQSVIPGDSYLLLTNCTGTTKGQVLAISQTISGSAMGLVWSADQHAIVAGDFNGDHKADLFLQATSPTGVDAIVLADSNGQFTSASPAQTWSDGYLGFLWSTFHAIVHAADFNGDGRADLLIQARPVFVQITVLTPNFPIPAYPANMDGIAFSEASSPTTTPIFALSGPVSPAIQAWSRFSNGIDWSPLTNTLIVGDFNGDGRADIIAQAKNSNNTSHLLTADATGAIFPASGTAISSSVALSSNSAVLIAGNFDGSTTGIGVYMQALMTGGTNYVINSVGASVSPASLDSSQSYSYVYDALGRVTSVAYSSGLAGYTTTYAYDAAGNRTSRVTTVN
jgi:hypothetical protein